MAVLRAKSASELSEKKQRQVMTHFLAALVPSTDFAGALPPTAEAGAFEATVEAGFGGIFDERGKFLV